MFWLTAANSVASGRQYRATLKRLSRVHPGFSVYAGPPVEAAEMASLESQARYITRTVLAMDALEKLDDGNLVLETPPDPRTGATSILITGSLPGEARQRPYKSDEQTKKPEHTTILHFSFAFSFDQPLVSAQLLSLDIAGAIPQLKGITAFGIYPISKFNNRIMFEFCCNCTIQPARRRSSRHDSVFDTKNQKRNVYCHGSL